MTFKRILVAVDGSEHSNKAVRTVVSMCDPNKHQCKVTVIHVVPFNHYYVGADIETLMHREGDRIIQSALDLFQSKGIQCESLVRIGNVPEQICLQAGNHDLIVLGSRGLGSIKEMILGSVSHSVSQLATCPVLIVK